jgi:hypothetical protein
VWDKIKGIIGGVAPVLGGALGGPLGASAAVAISNALGLNSSDPDVIESTVSNLSPDQKLALKKADNDFTIQVKQLGLSGLQAVYADRANARSMQDKDTYFLRKVSLWMTFGLVLVITASEIGLAAFDLLNSTEIAIISSTQGVLLAKFSTVIDFLFGDAVKKAFDYFKGDDNEKK